MYAQDGRRIKYYLKKRCVEIRLSTKNWGVQIRVSVKKKGVVQMRVSTEKPIYLFDIIFSWVE